MIIILHRAFLPVQLLFHKEREKPMKPGSLIPNVRYTWIHQICTPVPRWHLLLAPFVLVFFYQHCQLPETITFQREWFVPSQVEPITPPLRPWSPRKRRSGCPQDVALATRNPKHSLPCTSVREKNCSDEAPTLALSSISVRCPVWSKLFAKALTHTFPVSNSFQQRRQQHSACWVSWAAPAGKAGPTVINRV